MLRHALLEQYCQFNLLFNLTHYRIALSRLGSAREKVCFGL